jgi:hypothetical protein
VEQLQMSFLARCIFEFGLPLLETLALEEEVRNLIYNVLVFVFQANADNRSAGEITPARWPIPIFRGRLSRGV